MAHPLAAGVTLFNSGTYWHAHEAWEDVWRASGEPQATLLKGLIQTAAALVHWQRGNRVGLERNYAKARPKLLASRDAAPELDVTGLVAAMDAFLADGGAPPQLALAG